MYESVLLATIPTVLRWTEALIKKIFKAEQPDIEGSVKKKVVLEEVLSEMEKSGIISNHANVEPELIRKILSFLVDLIILILNHWFGKNWKQALAQAQSRLDKAQHS